MKFELKWSPLALAIVNILTLSILLVIPKAQELMPTLRYFAQKEQAHYLTYLGYLFSAYVYIACLCIIAAWTALLYQRHKLTSLFALIPFVPGLIIVYVYVKYSLLSHAKPYVDNPFLGIKKVTDEIGEVGKKLRDVTKAFGL